LCGPSLTRKRSEVQILQRPLPYSLRQKASGRFAGFRPHRQSDCGQRSRGSASQCLRVKVSSLQAHYLYGMDDVQVTGALAIEDLYKETGNRLWWALLAYTGDREIASDAAAEAFARALDTTNTIRDPAAWIWRVAFRVATTHLREARLTSMELNASYEMDQQALGVVVALRHLTRRQRAVFVLFYLDDRPTIEIAELLGMAPATVSVHLHNARLQLRAILGGDDA
jgi:RNA polymerase sigma factor (sigma-70 family)